jgi:putative hemolysin
MKKNISFFVLLSIVLLAGAGCSSKKTPTETTPQNNLIDNPLVETTEQQEAYLFCTKKGYEIQIRYEGSLNKNIAYCVFDETKKCESVAFLKDQCPEEVVPTEEEQIAKMFQPVVGDEFPLRLCEPIAQPVCGTDNKTYTNACVAEFLSATIQHQGSCDRPSNIVPTEANTERVVDISVIPGKNTPTKNSETKTNNITSPKTPTPGTTESANTNAWVEIPLSLLQSTAGQETRIDRCIQNGVTTFYVHDDFPTLYNAKGEVICYPKNDINNACPSFITNSTYQSSCTPVTR